MIQQEALNRNLKVQGFLEQAVARLLSSTETLHTSAPVLPNELQNPKLVTQTEQATHFTADCDSLAGFELTPEVGQWVAKLVRVLKAPQFAHAIQQNLDAFVLGIESVEKLANLEQGHDVPGASDDSEAGSSLQVGIAGVRASLARTGELLEGTGAAPQVVRKKAK